jgi:hypothetical protein
MIRDLPTSTAELRLRPMFALWAEERLESPLQGSLSALALAYLCWRGGGYQTSDRELWD